MICYAMLCACYAALNGKVAYLYVTVYEKMGPPAKKYDNAVFYIVG